MKRFELKTTVLIPAAALSILIVAGIRLLFYSVPGKAFTEELLIYDCIRLDFWALLFWFAMVTIWCSKLPQKTKAWLLVSGLSIYGLVTVSLILDGTPFSINAYWGDQKFRTAMVMRYMNSLWTVDMYYKDLPTFYPPLYYFILAIGSKISSLEAFRMLKIGSQLIYLVGPFVLYFMWRKLVTPLQAFLITLFTFLFCSIGKIPPLVSPHAFVGNSLFIPWWLHYVEGVGRRKVDWRHIAIGGLIGGVIFVTYYFAFFLGGLLIVVRLVPKGKHAFWRYVGQFDWKVSGGVLVGAAVVSSVYWLPLMISSLTNGYDPAQQRWHHLGSTGILFLFTAVTIPGILFLCGIVCSLRRPKAPINRALLLLTGATCLFYLLGTFLGGINKPVNLVKANEFVTYLAGPFVGLMVAGLMRWSQRRGKHRFVIPVLIAVLVPVFLHNFNAVAKKKMVRTARTAKVPSWYRGKGKIDLPVGSVVLTDREELFAFLPAYAFIANNEHYSHPGSRFKQRFDFLNLLQDIDDPFLFHLALRHNAFDPIDYFIPRLKDGEFEVLVSLSNYPNKHSRQYLRFDTTLVASSDLFAREKGDLYRVKDVSTYPVPGDGSTLTPEDGTDDHASLRALGEYLNPYGKEMLERYLLDYPRDSEHE